MLRAASFASTSRRDRAGSSTWRATRFWPCSNLAAGGVEAAWAIQQALADRAPALGGPQPMRFRIGVHLGDVIHRDDGTVYGDGVNIAARLQALAEPGGVVVSEAVLAVIGDRSGLAFVDRGEQRLKNIPRPVRIHALAPAGAPAEVASNDAAEAADAPTATPPTNLPLEHEPLISRGEELRALGERVLQDRLTTLVGPGGIGKTRLAGAVAQGRKASFPDGVWWVDLAAVSAGERVPQAVAQASGTALGDGDGPILLARALIGRRLLLVLDNCEHLLVGVAAVLTPLLAAAAGVHVLATSQVRLDVAGEQVWRLDALDLPPANSVLEVARTFGAVQLFERRARAADQHFSLDAATTAIAIEVCTRLDGNALAIEMAAAWAPFVGLPALRKRLVERLRLFTTANRTLPSRQRSLRATLDWSHSLLGSADQLVLRRLSAFVGAFRLDHAQQVVSESGGIDEWEVLDALRTLVDRSLVQVEPTRPPRYRLLESIRLYAAEQLASAGETERVDLHHDQAFARLAVSLRDDYRVLSHTDFLESYAADFADMNATFFRACERKDAATGALTGAALMYFAGAFGVNTELRRLARAAFDLLPAAQDPLDRALLWRQVATATGTGVPVVPRLLAARECVQAWRAVGDAIGLYVTLAALATECARGGDFAGATAAAREARTIEDPSWPPRLHSISMRLDFDIARYSGDVRAAREGVLRALALAESTGDTRDVMDARADLATLAVAAGDVDEAIALAREGVEFGRRTRRPNHEGDSLLTLCNAAAIAGDDPGAAQAALDALPVLRLNLFAAPLFDAVALLSARTGDAADAVMAARFIGYADQWYAVNQTPQRAAAEARVQSLALAAIDAAIGEDARRKVREEGMVLSDEQADKLAAALLERVRRSPAGRVGT